MKSLPLLEWCSVQDAVDYLTEKLNEKWTKAHVHAAGERGDFFVQRIHRCKTLDGTYRTVFRVNGKELEAYVTTRLAETRAEETSRPIANWKMAVQAQAAIFWRKYRGMVASPTKYAIKGDLARWCRDNKVMTETGINPSEDYIYRHVLRKWTPPTD